jgi:hypothetical protein
MCLSCDSGGLVCLIEIEVFDAFETFKHDIEKYIQIFVVTHNNG